MMGTFRYRTADEALAAVKRIRAKLLLLKLLEAKKSYPVKKWGKATLIQAPYPAEWLSGEIQARVREKANHQCEHCGMAFHPGTNIAVSATNANGKPVIGTVHHLDGNPQNCTPENLLFACQRCHLHIQALWQPGGVLPACWQKVPDWIVKRGLVYQPGQLPLFAGES